MRKQILLLACICALSFSYAQDQYKILFSYDSAGNQTSRNKICVNCSTDSVQVNDSTVVTIIDKEDELLKKEIGDSPISAIFAYPNPVTNVLRVAWVASDNYVQSVSLFSWSGQQLSTTKVHTTQLSTDLSFGKYPPGVYIVVVFYTDKKSESFQIIKK